MGLGGNTISSWEQMRRVFLSKYQEYCKTRDIQDEIFTIVQNNDETLEEYLERFLYILQRLKHKFDLSTIRTLFLCGLIDDIRNNLNLLGQGDISQETFDAMIIGLGSKMDNMKIEIMNIVTKQIGSSKFR